MLKPRGFTLIEVLVALTVVGVALAAALRAAAGMHANSDALERKVYATWSAESRLAEIRLARTLPPLGEREFACPQGRAPLVCVENVQSTPNTGFRRIEVSVFADGTRDWRLVTLATVVGNVR